MKTHKKLKKNQDDNEDSVVGNVSISTNATIQDHTEAYFAWWLTRWGNLECHLTTAKKRTADQPT